MKKFLEVIRKSLRQNQEKEPKRNSDSDYKFRERRSINYNEEGRWTLWVVPPSIQKSRPKSKKGIYLRKDVRCFHIIIYQNILIFTSSPPPTQILR